MSKTFNQALYEALKELKVIDDKVLTSAYKKTQSEHTALYQLLVQEDLIDDKDIGRIMADIYQLPFINLREIKIKAQVFKLIPEEFARENSSIFFKKTDTHAHLATSNPDNRSAISYLQRKLDVSLVVHFATPHDLDDALLVYKKDVKKMFQEILEEQVRSAKIKDKAEPPIIKIVDTIIEYAYEKKASDIHLEPADENFLVRFRIDGILHDFVKLPIELHQRVVTRIKVLAKLRTDEHQAAQDGKLQIKMEGEYDNELDIRISIVPSTNGEKVVMRLLSERSRKLSLSDLGFQDYELKKLKNAYSQAHGMLLSTGPTGSGKTTTMYSILKLLNRREVNISTIEDPVEYDLPGITQIQVNPKTELTFAKGLRSIVRQDPDIILVGEIRDNETADIATNAAMTGHLVLSTLHTNDAATAIPRLIDMEVEPFLIASTINVIIAQRLVRKTHLACRVSKEVERKVLEKYFSPEIIQKVFGDEKTIRVYEGQGCEVCNHTGFIGRVGIFELLSLDDEIREAIIAQKDAASIETIAIKNGMKTMLEDGLEKVKNGLTSVEEILRVTKEK